MLNQDLSSLDLSKVAALQHKRTLAFVNHFVSTNIQFLNSFIKKCELKLMNFERKLEKVEATMVLLEARLSSIPEVSNITETPKPTSQKPFTDQNISRAQTDQNVESIDIEKSTMSKSEDDADMDNPVQVPPEYERFVKMVQVGVPVQAVKLKVSLEGLDPDILVKILGK